jgi:hypothetical protein
MKKFIFITAIFCSAHSFSAEMIAEAQCSGTEDGQTITVTSYVNQKKFCSSSSRNEKSVVMVGEGAMGMAYSSLASESRGVLKYVSGTGESKMELIMKVGEETGVFTRNGNSNELQCFTIEYEMEC